MHQVVWAKLLVGLIGATAYAQATVLAVFMGGLAIGAVVFGRLVDRGWRPLRTYVVLELVIAGYCLFLPLLVWAAGVGYVSLAAGSFGSTGRELLLRFGLSLLVLLLPAVLMGGTLPVLARHLVGEIEETQNRVASLYALNGFGAVLGAGVAGFLTLPLLGVYGSLAGASLLNAVAAALVWELARKEQPEDEPPAQPKSDPPEFASAYRPEQYMTTLVALALSGFAAMGYEVLFSRVIALAFGGSAHSFTVMLMSFITGISLGSLIISRVRVERPLWLLGISQLAVPVALIAVTPLVSRLPYLMALMRIELGQAPAGFEL